MLDFPSEEFTLLPVKRLSVTGHKIEWQRMRSIVIADHLPRTFSDHELAALFRPFGSIRSARVVYGTGIYGTHGPSLEFGFIEFDKEEEANRAIAALNGHEVDGRRLTVALVRDSAPPAA